MTIPRFFWIALVIVFPITAIFLSVMDASPTLTKPVSKNSLTPSTTVETFPDTDQISTLISSYAFTYRPIDQPSSAWPDNTARLLFPARLQTEEAPRVHAFIYLPGTNVGDRLPESTYLAMLRSSLQRVSGTKNIVIMTPHHNQSGDAYPGFHLEDFYGSAVRALHDALPRAQITDVTIGGHDSATCGDRPVLLRAYDQSPPILRSIIAYDGCLGDVITPENTNNTSGISLYLAPDTSGMGKTDPASVSGYETRTELVHRLWRFGSVPKACPPCVSSTDSQARCYGQNPSFTRPDGGKLISLETSVGHDNSVGVITDIAFCEM